VSFGSPAPRRPGIVVFRAPGPEGHNYNMKTSASTAITTMDGKSYIIGGGEHNKCNIYSKLTYKHNCKYKY
jgi:hypothetical protein